MMVFIPEVCLSLIRIDGDVWRFRGESEMRLEVKIRNEEWLREQNMNAFLAVAKGSSQKPYLLELHLTHPRASAESIEQPLVLVGKGICFDSGGISIKPAASMGLMRGDMGGAACVAATALGVSYRSFLHTQDVMVSRQSIFV